MTVTCTGAEFNAFMTDKQVWRDDHWFDDVAATVDGRPDELDYCFSGEDFLPPAASVEITGGEYHVGPGVGSTFYSFEQTLADWLKRRTSTIMVIEVPNDAVAALTQSLGVYSARVISPATEGDIA